MKVRFKGSAGMDQGVREGSDALSPGAEYTVLEVSCQADGPNRFRIEYSDSELPPLFDSRLFEILDSEFHASWELSLEWDGSITIGPAAWSVSGFWEDFMDGDGRAVEIYRSERARIMGE
jgi:hypothetical protein